MSSLDYVIHYHVARLRVKGSGVLKLKLLSLDEIETINLPSITMSATVKKPETVITDFTQFRACLEFRTTEINERFEIGDITVYAKPIGSSLP